MSASIRTLRAELAFDVRNELGEGPFWDDTAQVLYWVDLFTARLFRGNPATGAVDVRTLAYRAARVSLCDDGRLFFAFTRGPAFGSFGSDVYEKLGDGFTVPETVRINDGTCDSRGRYWTGTYDPTLKSAIGAIYCVAAGRAIVKAEGIALSNGIRFSPDERTMVFVDSRPGRIWAYDFDIESASLGARRLLVDYEGSGVKPDGCAMDAEGCLWVAEVGRARVARYTPQGVLDQVVEVPTDKPTSASFGGADRRTLFITTRSSGIDAADAGRQPLAGAVFAALVAVPGLPEHRYRIGR